MNTVTYESVARHIKLTRQIARYYENQKQPQALALMPAPVFNYTHSDKIDPPEPWQIEDIENLMNHDFSANWSQMGCKKTSTGLWLIQRLMKERGITNPAVLICTSKSGKGTFYQLAPHILEGYVILSVQADGMYIVRDGKETKLPGLDHCPEAFDFPAVVLVHYDLFSKANVGKYYRDKETMELVRDPVTKEAIALPWSQGDFITERWWDYIWIDEAHKIKDRKGKRAVNIKKIKTRFGRHLSTGTGFINRPDEIWSLLNFLSPQRYGGYWTFRKAFCAESSTGTGYTMIEGIKPNMVEGFRKVVRDVGPRRTLREVMPQLKEPIPITREVELSPIQRRIYNEIKSELKALDSKGVPIHAPNVLAALQRLRQIAVATPELTYDDYDDKKGRRIIKVKLNDPSSKLDAVQDILEDSDEDDLFVVFSCFKDPLELLANRLNPRYDPKGNLKVPGTPYIWMHSEDDDQTRYQKWHEEFPKRKHKVFMSTLQLGGESINLTPANYLIFLDRSWSPKDNLQAIGRIDRPGQDRQPFIININAKNTIDARVKDVNDIKGKWFNDIFGNDA